MARKGTTKKAVDVVEQVPLADIQVAPPVKLEPVKNDTIKSVELMMNSDFDDNINSTEVYDEGDIASALELGFIAQALKKHKEKVAPERHPDFDGVHCIQCWEDIPQVRLDLGKIRCVHCQAALEKTNKLYGRR
jgi:RNA polymerase-binding transcription factor DksA